MINNAKLKAKIIYGIKNFIAILPFHILVMSSVAIISFIFDKWLEALFFLISFFTLRYKFPTTFHANKILHCMVITNCMFAISIVLCPSIYMYVFGSLLFGYLDAFLLWYIQSREDFKRQKECAEWFCRELIAQITEKQNPYEELLERCKNAKLSERDTEIAIRYFYKRNSTKDIWLWLCEQKQYEVAVGIVYIY